mgnify:FL=1
MKTTEDTTFLNLDEAFDSPLDHLSDADGPPPNVEEMLAALESGDSEQRILAARAFCEIEDQRAIAPLIQLLDDPCPLVRVSAAYGLGRNTSPEAIAALVQRYDKEWNGYARKGIVWALGTCQNPETVDPLLKALKTDIAAVRLWAASSLGQMGEADYENAVKAVPPLIIALRQDPVPAVRGNCAWSLGQLCRDLPSNAIYAGAVDALIEALVEEEELGIKDDARSALLKLGDPRALQIIEELEQEGWL